MLVPASDAHVPWTNGKRNSKISDQTVTLISLSLSLFPQPCRKLAKVLNYYVANAENAQETDHLFAALKVLKYVFRFIIQSRELYL
eukprot:g16809.t1